MKKKAKTMQKMRKTHKAINQFITQTIKNFQYMRNKIKVIWATSCVALCLTTTSCGTTHVSVNRPNNGTYTQITVTTNNPITTTTDADASAQIK